MHLALDGGQMTCSHSQRIYGKSSGVLWLFQQQSVMHLALDGGQRMCRQKSGVQWLFQQHPAMHLALDGCQMICGCIQMINSENGLR